MTTPMRPGRIKRAGAYLALVDTTGHTILEFDLPESESDINRVIRQSARAGYRVTLDEYGRFQSGGGL